MPEPINSPAGRTFAEARWLAAVNDLSVRKEMCDIITLKRNPENSLESNMMWLAAWDAIEAIRLAQEAANDKVSYHADNAGGAHGKDTNDK